MGKSKILKMIYCRVYLKILGKCKNLWNEERYSFFGKGVIGYVERINGDKMWKNVSVGKRIV